MPSRRMGGGAAPAGRLLGLGHSDRTERLLIALASATLMLCFFAGRSFDGPGTVPFTHEEVLDAVTKCEEGNYIGSCVDCRVCADYEYANGGCSFFKDTFCSYCDPVPHCAREDTRCTTKHDQRCLKCECTDPALAWGDLEIELYKDNMEAAAVQEGEESEEDEGEAAVTPAPVDGLPAGTYACYWGDDCRPCTVCAEGEYEYEKCSQEYDTDCRPCKQCGDEEFTKETCTLTTNTVCEACNYCFDGTWTETACSPGKWNEASQDATCQPCSDCMPGDFVEEVCNKDVVGGDTVCTQCKTCQDGGSADGGEYIGTPCDMGTYRKYGADTLCTECTPDEEVDEEGVRSLWESSPCLFSDTMDAVFTECTVCTENEWEVTSCSPSADAVCQACNPIPHCPMEHTVCRDDTKSDCLLGAEYGVGACDENYSGTQCTWMKTYTECGGLPYMVRTGRAGGYGGQENAEFVEFCREYCAEYPDCIAFEVPDRGHNYHESGHAKFGTDTECAMYNTVTAPGNNTRFDCYSDISRQNELEILTAFNATIPAVVA